MQKALDVLHKNNYDIGRALLNFTPNNVPIICKDELEEWTPAEASLFEDSLDKYGKSFIEIRKDVFPWKKMKNIVEYYYMWKTTDRYVPQKRIKAQETESKLKQVYIPNTNNNSSSKNSSTTNGVGSSAILGDAAGKNCESCAKSNSSLWYAYGVVQSNQRLCSNCWTYYKKFGGLRYPTNYQDILLSKDKQLISSSTTAPTSPTPSATSGNGQTDSVTSPSQLNNLSSSTTKESNNQQQTSNNSSNNNNNNSDAELVKCKECNKTFNRQGNDAHVVLNLMVKNKRNDEGDDFNSLCNNCLSSKKC